MLMPKIETDLSREISDISRMVGDLAMSSHLGGEIDGRIAQPVAKRMQAIKHRFKGGRGKLAAEASGLLDQLAQGGPIDQGVFFVAQNVLGRLQNEQD